MCVAHTQQRSITYEEAALLHPRAFHEMQADSISRPFTRMNCVIHTARFLKTAVERFKKKIEEKISN